MGTALSIIIPVHNQSHLLTRMLDSIEVQDFASQIEVIVVNDASEDRPETVLDAWREQKIVPVHVISNERRLFALGSRLKGLECANSEAVLFVDADDRLLGTSRLGSALDEFKRTDSDILHFSAVGVKKNGALHQSIDWANPMARELEGRDIFSTYIEQSYPPCLIWNKIFSRDLLLQVAEEIKDMNITRFDDKCLVTTAMVMAGKYRAYDEPVYEYLLPQGAVMEKYAARIKDLYSIKRLILQLLDRYCFPTSIKDSFKQYIAKRITINGGNLSLCMAKEIEDNGLSQDEVLDRLYKVIDEKLLLESLLISGGYNSENIISKIDKMFAY